MSAERRPRDSQAAAAASVTRHRLAPLILLGALLAAGGTTLMSLPVQWTGGVIAPRIFDALHLPLFALATPALFALLPARWSLGRRLLFAGLLGLGFAAAIELIQPFTGRSASWTDFLFGAMGVGLAVWLIAHASRSNPNLRERVGIAVATMVALLIVAAPVWSAYQKSTKVGEAFPSLLPSDAAALALFWKTQGQATVTISDLTSSSPLAVTTQSGEWSGVSFVVGSQDWSSMSALLLQIHSVQDKPFTLGLRIDDRNSSGHDSRFNHQFELRPGNNVFRVPVEDIKAGPANRSLDLAQVSRLALFVAPATPSQTFVIERAVLE